MLLAADLSASESARRVYLIAGALVLLGIALLVLTIWFWRSTRPEHPSLAPLEIMSDRSYAKLDEPTRARRREAVRVRTAGVQAGHSPRIDLEAAARETPIGFDDLSDISLDARDDTLATPAPAGIDPLIAQTDLDAADVEPSPPPAPVVELASSALEPPEPAPSELAGVRVQTFGHDTVHDRG